MVGARRKPHARQQFLRACGRGRAALARRLVRQVRRDRERRDRRRRVGRDVREHRFRVARYGVPRMHRRAALERRRDALDAAERALGAQRHGVYRPRRHQRRRVRVVAGDSGVPLEIGASSITAPIAKSPSVAASAGCGWAPSGISICVSGGEVTRTINVMCSKA
jgi:hypothetical protein